MKTQPIRLTGIRANIRIKNTSAKQACPLTPAELFVRSHKFALIVMWHSSSCNILKINILVVFWSCFCKVVSRIVSTPPRGRSRSTSVLFPKESNGVNSVLTSSKYFPVHRRARSGIITYYIIDARGKVIKSLSLSLFGRMCI